MCSLARQCAQLWVKTRESLGHPLGISYDANSLIHPSIVEFDLKKVCLLEALNRYNLILLH